MELFTCQHRNQPSSRVPPYSLNPLLIFDLPRVSTLWISNNNLTKHLQPWKGAFALPLPSNCPFVVVLFISPSMSGPFSTTTIPLCSPLLPFLIATPHPKISFSASLDSSPTLTGYCCNESADSTYARAKMDRRSSSKSWFLGYTSWRALLP